MILSIVLYLWEEQKNIEDNSNQNRRRGCCLFGDGIKGNVEFYMKKKEFQNLSERSRLRFESLSKPSRKRISLYIASTYSLLRVTSALGKTASPSFLAPYRRSYLKVIPQ
jgi:hypothetical protein